MVGADLANVANEAALLAAKRGHTKVARLDMTDALERIVLGAERKVMLTEDDRRRTAYHEAGHAMMGMLTPGADPVRKVSIIPRGMALGVTFSAPDADRFNFDQRHLIAQIKVALGGRAAEEIVFGDLTTGAESDIQQLTRIARMMVGRWGMSPAIGPVAVIPVDGFSQLLPGVSETSETTQRIVDEEVRRIVESAHEEATASLLDHRANLDSLVAALLEQETLDETDAYAAAGLPRNAAATPEEAPPVVPSYGASALQRPPAGEPGLRLVPEADLVLLVDQPAQVHLLPVSQRREVDQPALEVAQHDIDGLELAHGPAQLDQRRRHVAARVRAAVAGVQRHHRLARARTHGQQPGVGVATQATRSATQAIAAAACSTV